MGRRGNGCLSACRLAKSLACFLSIQGLARISSHSEKPLSRSHSNPNRPFASQSHQPLAPVSRWNERPGIQAAIAGVKKSQFQAPIVLDHTGLGRDIGVSRSIRDQLQSAGVQIHYIVGGGYKSDSESGLIMDTVSDMMSELEIKRFVRRSRAGRYKAVEQGDLQIGGRVPFGYKRLYATKDRGQRLDIDPAEAAIVRQVFRWVGAGVNYEEVAGRLTNKGVQKHSQFPWSRHDIYRMVRHEFYIGNWYFGKTNIDNGKQVKVPKDKCVKAEVPAIIDKDTWRKAQTRIKATTRAYRGRVSHCYLLRERIVCADCKRIYNAHTRRIEGRTARSTVDTICTTSNQPPAQIGTT